MLRRLTIIGASMLLAGGAWVAVTTPADAATVRVINNVTYTTGTCPGRGTQAQQLNAYLPNVSTVTPIVVLVHGGSFVHGSKDDRGIVAEATTLAQHGWAAVTIDYCLPPEGTSGYPTEINNVVAAVNFVSAHAAQYNADRNRLGIWGFSAGASLSLVTAGKQGRTSTTGPIAVAAGWSGPYDMVDMRGAAQRQIDMIHNYLGCSDLTVPSCKARATGASATTYVTTNSPPTFLANSTNEIAPLQQVDDMTSALGARSVPYQTLILPGSRHAQAYEVDAFCPTVAYFSTYLGTYQGTCAPPA